MMVIGAGLCFAAALALGYVQENTLPTTLLRAIVAMLAGLFLTRWWGLMLKRQLSAAALEGVAENNDSPSPSDQKTEDEKPSGGTPETEGST